MPCMVLQVDLSWGLGELLKQRGTAAAAGRAGAGAVDTLRQELQG